VSVGLIDWADCADTPNILFNGGKPVYVPLRPPSGKGKQTSSADWKLNIYDLRAATTSKTRMLIFKCVRSSEDLDCCCSWTHCACRGSIAVSEES